MQDDVLILEFVGQVACVRLNRPRAMNALNGRMIDALEQALDRFEADPEVRAIVLTGAGPAFCAGADLKEALLTKPAPGEPDFLHRAAAMMQRLRDLPKPVIAALNGVTLAGGLELAMCADIILAAESAEIGDAHANYGVFPGAGGAAVLPRLLPLPTALYMLFTGRSLSAARLHQLGFVSEVHPDAELQAAALALAAAIAAKSPSTIRRMKAVARASADGDQAAALAHEQTQLLEHLQTEDLQEGLRAFAEKRTPRFTGR